MIHVKLSGLWLRLGTRLRECVTTSIGSLDTWFLHWFFIHLLLVLNCCGLVLYICERTLCRSGRIKWQSETRLDGVCSCRAVLGDTATLYLRYGVITNNRFGRSLQIFHSWTLTTNNFIKLLPKLYETKSYANVIFENAWKKYYFNEHIKNILLKSLISYCIPLYIHCKINLQHKCTNIVNDSNSMTKF